MLDRRENCCNMNSMALSQGNPRCKAVALLTSFFHNSIPDPTNQSPTVTWFRTCNPVSFDCAYRGYACSIKWTVG